jgi:hypothetical protein
MADDPKLAPDPAPAPEPAPKDPAPAPVLSGGGADPAPEPAEPTAPDWRTRYAGDDKAALKRAEKWASEQDFFKSYRSLENRLRTGQTFPELPEGATPEEVTAHRKALGIPEKAEGYGIVYPDDLKPTEADTAALNAFQQFMHDRHVPPSAAKAAFEFYMTSTKAGQEARAEAANEATLQSIADLRSEWKGREYTRNLTLAKEFLAGTGAFAHLPEPYFDPEAMESVLKVELPNGVKLGDYAPFVKGFAKLARSLADEEALIGGDGAGGGKSIDDEIAELRTKSVTGKITKAEDARLNQLYEARIAREERQGRRSAA